MSELWELGALELGAAIRNETVSSREVVEAHLARVEAVNPAVNAVTVTLDAEALAAADAADAAIARDEPTGPFHGVPFTIKENVDLAGSPTTQGVTALAEMVPPLDAPAVEHLRAAGAIPFARTNLPDLGLRWHTDNELRGPTCNPWDSARTPGGSSGGEAAALASGMTPLGIGSDLGGSLRWPSACCGTMAMRPTLGRIPVATSLEPADQPLTMQLMAVERPMARGALDLRVSLEIMSRHSDRDPWYAPVPVAGRALRNPIRVATVTDPSGRGVDPAVANGVQRVAAALADAGYGAAFMTREGIARAWTQFLSEYPLVLAPVATELPFAVGTDLAGPEAIDRIRRSLDLTLLCNCIGLPAVALPAGTEDRLPIGVQIIGPRYREDVCLTAAWEVERTLGAITPIDPRQ